MRPTGLFITWMILTIILTFSLIGIILFIPNGAQPSTWMKIGLNLLDKIKSENEQNNI
jgi:hypothetical protein